MFRAAAVVSALVLLSCGSDGASPNAARSSAPAATTSSTTVPPTTVTAALQPASSAAEASTQFVNAWKTGNRLLASVIAVPDAVDVVFNGGDPGSVQSRGCNQPPADSPVLCVYKTDLGELQVRVQPRPDGWIVDHAKLSPA